MDYRAATQNRITHQNNRSLLDVHTQLRHFAIISYQLPIDRLKDMVPSRFKIWTFTEDGIEYGLISAVTFLIKKFSFYKISKYPKFEFFQTDFRTYIYDGENQNHAIWFLGTTLGSLAYIIPKYIWKMPCVYGRFEFQYQNKDHEYQMNFRSNQGLGQVNIKNMNREVNLLKGFSSIDQQTHILTHPVTGYYPISKKTIGSYEIWHPQIKVTEGIGLNLYFELFERLALLSKEEMNHPHSILMSPRIEFHVLLPPYKMNSD